MKRTESTAGISFATSAISHIVTDVVRRCYTVVGAALVLPKALAAPNPKPTYPLLGTSHPSYEDFQASPTNETTALADIFHFADGELRYAAWRHRADVIRLSGNSATCTGNLSVALAEVGAAYSASSNGSTTLLTLLPTAGALVGAPAKELWVLAELFPLAGFLSMALALGGNIVPHQVGDYASLDDFSHRDMRSNPPVQTPDPRRMSILGTNIGDEIAGLKKWEEAEQFAAHVLERAQRQDVSDKRNKAGAGILALCLCIAAILVACRLLQSGAIVVWWCTSVNWTYYWYLITILASILEFVAGVPFTRSWKIRVSQAPESIVIPSDAPRVNRDAEVMTKFFQEPTDQSEDDSEKGRLVSPQTTPETPKTPTFKGSNVIKNLKDGFKPPQGKKITMDKTLNSTASKDAFYVIISCENVHKRHIALRLFSKLISVGAFTFSTALFASAALVQVTIATVVMTLILAAGIFGRVTAMWISAIILKDKPVLHRVVKGTKEANLFMEEVLTREGLVCEVMGHVFINGQCVQKRRLNWSSVFGVLAPAFDVDKFAEPAHAM